MIITTYHKIEAALWHAKKAELKESHRFEKMLEKHYVFVVDEGHQTIIATGMLKIK